MRGIPWRFDVENMPKDGSWVLYLEPPEGAHWPVCLRWGEEDFRDRDRWPWDITDGSAWCPIDKPEVTVDPEGEQNHE